MTTAGWIFLLVSWSAILSLCSFCFWRVMASSRANIHAPLDIDTDEHDQHGDATTRSAPPPPRETA